MQGLMDTYMLYSYSRGIEELKFFNNHIDYLFYLFIIIPIILLSSVFFLPIPLLQPALLGALTYTWSRSNKDHQVNIYFISIKASLLPIVTLGFRLLLEGTSSFLAVFSGMTAAYIYACIESWSLGPLYNYFCETFGIRINNRNSTRNINRVGTLNEIKENNLKAPLWFKKFIELFLGNGSRFGSTTNKNKIHTLSTNSGTTSSGSTSSSSSSSSNAISSGSIFGNNKFKGKGYRLGSD